MFLRTIRICAFNRSILLSLGKFLYFPNQNVIPYSSIAILNYIIAADKY